jgi:ribosome-dependent ATPase
MISSRGAFSKALGMAELLPMITELAVAAMAFTLLGIALVKKQDG